MQEPDIGVKPGKDAGLLNQRIEDAVTVVQVCIKGIFCWPPGAPFELIFFREHAR